LVSTHLPRPRTTLFPYTTLFRSCEDADETAALLRRVGDALFVVEAADVRNGVVCDRELDVRILRRILLHRVAEQEAGGDHDLRVVLNHSGVVVRLVVARRVRDDSECLALELLRRPLETGELGLVEPVVVEAGDVAHERRPVTRFLCVPRLRTAKRGAD